MKPDTVILSEAKDLSRGDSSATPQNDRRWKQAEILLTAGVDHGFDYQVPDGMQLAPGDIVSVPFGRGSSLGVVWQEGTANIPEGKMRPVGERLEQFPPLSEAMRQFIDWAAWYNCAPKGAMLKMTLPVSEAAKEGRLKSTRFETHAGNMHIALADLSETQQKAARELCDKIDQGFSITLLDGVTGSGKTEVYFDAIA